MFLTCNCLDIVFKKESKIFLSDWLFQKRKRRFIWFVMIFWLHFPIFLSFYESFSCFVVVFLSLSPIFLYYFLFPREGKLTCPFYKEKAISIWRRCTLLFTLTITLFFLDQCFMLSDFAIPYLSSSIMVYYYWSFSISHSPTFFPDRSFSSLLLMEGEVQGSWWKIKENRPWVPALSSTSSLLFFYNPPLMGCNSINVSDSSLFTISVALPKELCSFSSGNSMINFSSYAQVRHFTTTWPITLYFCFSIFIHFKLFSTFKQDPVKSISVQYWLHKIGRQMRCYFPPASLSVPKLSIISLATFISSAGYFWQNSNYCNLLFHPIILYPIPLYWK